MKKNNQEYKKYNHKNYYYYQSVGGKLDDENTQTIEPTRNGPYLVRNLKKLKNSKNEVIKSYFVITLCRCGESNI